MSKNKLVNNIFIFALSTFIPKALSFFLVPLYTNCLSTAEYGIVDLIMTTVALLYPILTLDISDSVMRFTIEDKKNEKPYNVGIMIFEFGTAILIIGVLFLYFAGILNFPFSYIIYLIINYIVTALYAINISYLRATDQVGLLAICSIVVTLINLLANILFLAILKWNIVGYMISSVFGTLVINIFIICKIHKLKSFVPHMINKELMISMIKFSTPLVFSGIAWWVNSTSDKYFVTYFCGASANGVYSVAYKIPTILQMIQSVISQAWLITLYDEYKKENSSEYINKIYNYYSILMILSCGFLILLDIPLAFFLYAKDFFVAWKVVPVLLISVVFIAMAGFTESLLTLQKQTKTIANTTIAGAVVNTIFNIVLIPRIGVMGAAIATALGYAFMWILRMFILSLKGEIIINIKIIRSCITYIALFLQAYIMIKFQKYFVCLLILIVIGMVNYSDTIGMIKLIVVFVKQKIHREKR